MIFPLSGKDVLVVICAGKESDKILIGRKPLNRLQFIRSEPFSGFVF